MFCYLLVVVDQRRVGIIEIVIVGDWFDLVGVVWCLYWLYVVIVWGEWFDLLLWEGWCDGLVYVCWDYAC